MSSLNKLLQDLGVYKNKNLFYLENDNWKQSVPYRLQKGIEVINPSAFWVQDNKPVVLFFEFDNQTFDKTKIFKKIWNLGGIPIIFIVTNNSIDIYNGISFDTKTGAFEKIKNDKILSNKSDFIWSLVSGKVWENLTFSKNRVDEKLLENIRYAQQLITKDKKISKSCANNIIGRLLFSRYLIDREVKIDKKFFHDNDSFLLMIEKKKLLYEYFDYLKKTFNGDLFPVTDDEIKNINNNHLNILYRLFKGDALDTGQISLFNTYDFRIIPVELISEVYERFIGPEMQRKEGAYYTPSFLVDYVLSKTVKIFLQKNDNCKILDPSCGSGIFLVEALRFIVEKNKIDNKISKESLTKIVKENIFGIDKDEDAINLSIFSVCLTLLDYIEPKDIAKYKFPTLKNKNLFIADFFDTSHEFNDKIKNINFILGNPPWLSDGKNKSHIEYSKKEKVSISDKQIAQSFVVRTKDFSESKTICMLILTSKIFYNHKASAFREFWLNNFYIDEVLELSPVRKQIFTNAIAPSAIVSYRYSNKKDTKDNILTYISIKPNIYLDCLKVIVIEKNDIKNIKQEYFQKYDWLWKIMLYGNVFDFYLIKRLKENFKSLNDVIKENQLSFGQGFIKNGENSKNRIKASHLLGKEYLNTRNKNLSKFYINDKELEKWTEVFVHRPRKESVFKAPYVLLKKGFDIKNFSLVSTYSEKDFVFTDSVTAINGKNNNKDKNILKSIVGVLNSTLSSYYFLMQGSSAGVEREQGHNKEDRFTIPIVIDAKISQNVDEIQDVLVKTNNKLLKLQGKDKEIEKIENQINDTVLDLFSISEFEKKLIDYAVNISIPVLSNNYREPNIERKQILINYVQIFLDYFGSKWNGNPDYFEIDIYLDRYFVCVNFKLSAKKRDNPIVFYEDSKIKEKILFLTKLTTEKITNKFYKQREIRGFNKTSFYIIKTNQFKNWHPAIAEVDLHEFISDMMRAN